MLPGKLVCNFGRSIIDCVVREISDHGAIVEVDSPFGIPPHFQLLISNEAGSRPCKLVRQSGKEPGIEFELRAATANETAVEPLDPERHKHATPSGQMLALRSVLNEIQNGALLRGAADRALYRANAEERNRTVRWPPLLAA